MTDPLHPTGGGIAYAYPCPICADKDAEIAALKQERDALKEIEKTLAAKMEADSALVQLADAADDPEAQDAIEADMKRMEREARERRAAEDAALVKPLVEALKNLMAAPL